MQKKLLRFSASIKLLSNVYEVVCECKGVYVRIYEFMRFLGVSVYAVGLGITVCECAADICYLGVFVCVCKF